jgi:alpha-ribazole phosphatase
MFPRDMNRIDDLKRTKETATLVNERLNVPVTYSADLREVDLGSLNGSTWQTINHVVGSDIYSEYKKQEAYDFVPWGGESSRDVKERVVRYIDTIKKAGEEPILLVTHGGIIRMLYFVYTGQTFEVVTNTSLHEFDI